MSTHQQHHDHDHQHCGHDHHHKSNDLGWRLFVCILIVVGVLSLMRPFIVKQMYLRVVSYSTYGLFDDVIRMNKKILFLDARHEDAWMMQGIAYEEKGMKDEAAHAFSNALNQNQHNLAAQYELGKIYYETEKYGPAMDFFEILRKEKPVTVDNEVLKYRHGPRALTHARAYEKMLLLLSKAYTLTQDLNASDVVKKEYEALRAKSKGSIF